MLVHRSAVQHQVHGQEVLAIAQDSNINISGCLWGGANMDVLQGRISAKLQHSTANIQRRAVCL